MAFEAVPLPPMQSESLRFCPWAVPWQNHSIPSTPLRMALQASALTWGAVALYSLPFEHALVVVLHVLPFWLEKPSSSVPVSMYSQVGLPPAKEVWTAPW